MRNRHADNVEAALKAAEDMFEERSQAIAAAQEEGSDYVSVEFAYQKRKLEFEPHVKESLERTSILRNLRHGNYRFGIIELFDKDPEIRRSFLKTLMESHKRVYVFVGADSLMYSG